MPGILPKNLLIFLQCSNKLLNIEGGAMVLGKLPVPGRPTIWIIVGLAVGAGGGCLDIFSRLSFLFSYSLSGRWPDID